MFSIFHISAFTVLIPIIISSWYGLYIGRKYFLLSALLIVGALNDVISYFTIVCTGTNTFNGNLYKLVEFSMMVLFFRRWTINKKNHYHFVILFIGIFIWILDNCILHTPFDNTSIFRLIGSILLVWVCVDQVFHAVLNRQNSQLLSDMLICGSLILYFLYMAFIESFQLFPIKMERPFYMKLWVIHSLINVFTNLMISIAFLCHRTKPNYTILSSPR
jgi:hypothetical protein